MKVGILGILTLIFVTLKLTDNIAWSWWAVLSPAILCALIWAAAVLLVAVKLAKKRSLRK